MRGSASRPTTAERRARAAVAALFLTNGALFANLIPRFPQIKADLELGNAAYGLAVAAFPAGAVAAGLLAGPVVRRLGSARTAVAGTLVTAAGVLAAALAPSVGLFVAAFVVGGAADAITDVGQNTHGLRVQRRYGRSIINTFHALWSIGAVLGGGMAAAAIALGVGRGVHLAVATGGFSLLALLALRWCLPGADERDPPSAADAPTAQEVEAATVTVTGTTDPAGPPAVTRPRRPRRGLPTRTSLVVAALVLVASSGTLVEDAGSTWAAVYLSTSLGAPAAVAATGFVALVGAQTVGRLLGDVLVDRFGERAVARTGGLVAAAGMGLALAVPTVPGTVAGFAAAGLGVATLVPAAMHQADKLPGLRPGTGLALVSWLMRLSFLLSPPLVGLVADAAGLRVGLLVVPLAGLTVLALSGVLEPRRRR
ncbi:MFS transporter [Pseudokineococcus sp. 1T1Z-3]|uniref:MFS transporter n=1 Tax=Pseudokineococcus sp. 1T1Z-3 TaxID=3132745 RepID=UPI0030B5DFD6